MVNMEPWIHYWESMREEYERQLAEFEQATKDVGEEMGIAQDQISFELEFRPVVILHRDKEGLLTLWNKPEELRGEYLCSMWWSAFNGGQAMLNRDGSVSYAEINTWRTDIIVNREYYLGIIQTPEGLEFRLVEEPDYNAADYLPFSSPEEYEEYIKSQE